MFKHELKATGLRDANLLSAYQACGRYLARRNSAAYPVARFLLPPARRPYYDAFLAFTGRVDELLDAGDQSIEDRDSKFTTFVEQFFTVLTDDLDRLANQTYEGTSEVQLISAAFAHAVVTWGISHDSVHHALETMRADLHVRSYPTFDALQRYMSGVSGEAGRWVNILMGGESEEAAHKAVALSHGVYLLDFLADIGEDIDLGRVYLPLEDLQRYNISREDLEDAARRRQITEPIREMIAYQASRISQHFDEADGWHKLVHPSCQELPRQYLNLGRDSLRLVVRSNYDVLRNHPALQLRSLGYALGSTALSYLRAFRDHRHHPSFHPPHISGSRPLKPEMRVDPPNSGS